MGRKVFVVGVGMTRFTKPHSIKQDFTALTKEAIGDALKDAGISYSLVEQATVGYVFGDSTKGQKALYETGMTGIPIYNVNNNCSTGSTALFMAKQFIEGGLSECVLALGFEKMESGSLDSDVNNTSHPLHKHWNVMKAGHGETPNVPQNPQMFGNAAREHMQLYGTKPEHFAKIAYKNHLHSVENERAQFRTKYTLEQVQKSRQIYDPLTLLMCSPTSDGAAAAIVASEDFVKKHHLENNAIEIVGMSMATDLPSAFNEGSSLKMIGFDMAQKAANAVYKQSGLCPNDVQVIELHDCFASNELFTYEALGLCPIGKGGELVDRGDNTYGGKWVVNPSGGLISKGHPLGATGLAQCAELCWQLRGLAGKRQVPNAKVGMQHNLGLGGAVVVTMYKKGFAASPASSRL